MKSLIVSILAMAILFSACNSGNDKTKIEKDAISSETLNPKNLTADQKSVFLDVADDAKEHAVYE